jgi:HAD superfamily hydrolase (TIGR01509 family)
MIRAVLFDLDGTLVDFHPTPPRALFDAGAARAYAYLTSRGCSMPAFEPFRRHQRRVAWQVALWTRLSGGEPDGRRHFRRICRDYGIQRDEMSLARLGCLWYEPVAETASLPPDVIPTLAALRDGDVKLALVVNTPHQGIAIDEHLAALGLLEFFPVRAYSSELGSHKPHPHLFNKALTDLGVAAAEALFVGNDAKADVMGARRLGMRTVLRSREGRRTRGSWQADHVVQRVGQLLDIYDIVPEAPGEAAPEVAGTISAAQEDARSAAVG